MDWRSLTSFCAVSGAFFAASKLCTYLQQTKTPRTHVEAVANTHEFDLDVRLLNLAPADLQTSPEFVHTHHRLLQTWSNLGYWEEQHDSYPHACTRMAHKLAIAADIRPSDWILDVGCGWGDQCIYFAEKFKPAVIQGINVSIRQLESAQQLITRCSLDHRIQMTAASATLLPIRPGTFDKVLALDCAYHFPPRRKFLLDAFHALDEDGILAFTDLILPRTPTSLVSQIALLVMCRLSRIPAENMLDLTAYVKELNACGFIVLEVAYWDQHVFDGYSQFIERHAAKYASQNMGDWMPLRVTGWILSLFHRFQLVHYCLIKARKEVHIMTLG
eukprot:TRINITY_DN9567_c0_g1_i1.p1 TRINITY_DN9567_c0_g1~~TRINITY_DN9567_c0_g1_i1.p1  ORF type:complete len:331 (+),score=52.94 TRINITY_DN9567_c0_g1_i1:81-1073(+)